MEFFLLLSKIPYKGVMEIAFFIVLFGLIFDYTNGFHDAANVVSTVIATRVLRPLSAVLLAGAFNLIGATQISGVAQTIAKGLIVTQDSTGLLVLSAVIGAIVWNLITWYYGIPSSSSYALIGGLIGCALLENGTQTVLWSSLLYKVIIPMLLSPFFGFFLGLIAMKALYLIMHKHSHKFQNNLFKHLQIGSVCAVSLAHGLNDAQKSMGLITLGLFSSGFIANIEIPFWVIISCAVMMGLGTASGGFKIIQTLGFSITKIEPMQGFVIETVSSAVILAASFLGIPVSSTQMITGSITGVGAAQGAHAVDWKVLRTLALTWICTLPGSGLVGAFFYWLFSAFLK